MKGLYGNLPVAILCGLFGKSRQAWYEMQDRKQEDRFHEQLILEMVRQLRLKLPRAGGVKLFKLLSAQFCEHRIQIGRDAFFDLLRAHHLLIQPKRRYVVTTQSFHHYKKWPDLVMRKAAQHAEEIWVSDITYLRTQTGFIYLSLITDAFSRKIVGYHLSQHLKAAGCIHALNKALNSRIYTSRQLIHHSDRGIQYCCDAYIEVLQKNNILISMSQHGSPYDNAIAERVNGILKSEFDLHRTFQSYPHAIEPVCLAIAAYNNLRPHYSCDLHTPEIIHRRESENTSNVFSDEYTEHCQVNLV